MGRNREIIKEQNKAAASKTGGYINKGEALARIAKRIQAEKEVLMKGKK